MSADVAAVKRLVTNLKTMHTRALKAAALDKAARDERTAQILGDYKTEQDIQDAYGYDLITDDERICLLAALEGDKNPIKTELTESEIYALEINDLLQQMQRRLHDLEWEELPSEEKARITQVQEERRSRLKALKENGL